MEPSLTLILDEAAGWLEVRQTEEISIEEGQALDRFRAFLASLSDADAPPKLEAACGLIGHWIVDQFDWSGPIFIGISTHVQRIRQYARDEAWRRHKLNAES